MMMMLLLLLLLLLSSTDGKQQPRQPDRHGCSSKMKHGSALLLEF